MVGRLCNACGLHWAKCRKRELAVTFRDTNKRVEISRIVESRGFVNPFVSKSCVVRSQKKIAASKKAMPPANSDADTPLLLRADSPLGALQGSPLGAPASYPVLPPVISPARQAVSPARAAASPRPLLVLPQHPLLAGEESADIGHALNVLEKGPA
jgi:hypothetical protein